MKSSQVLFCFVVLTGLAAAQIVPLTNDECGTAIGVMDGVNPSAPAGLSGNVYTNVGATTSVGSPAMCAAFGNDTWFSYVASTTGVTKFALCTPGGFVAGTLGDSVIQILSGAACPPTVALNCDDDSCTVGTAGVPSQVNTCTTMGTLYYIRVAGWAGGTGTFYLTITPQAAPTLANDDCSGAIALLPGLNGPFMNAGGADGCIQASCGFSGSPGFKDTWYSVTVGCGSLVTVATDCAGPDTLISAYATCGGPEIACNDDGALCGGGLGSSMTFPAVSGGTYLIRVASWANVATTFNITVSVTPGMAVLFTSPFGAGSLQLDIVGGPVGGTYFLAVTLFAGTFPSGWFYGLDVSVVELGNLINAGFPFIGPLDPTCGGFALGPFGGLPSGLALYAVAFGLAPGVPVPAIISAPTSYVIP